MKTLGMFFFVAIFTLGCGHRSSIERVPVEGNVTYNGLPIANGQIQFLPLDGTPGNAAGSPIVAGKYAVANKGGVPIGKHRVVIEGYQPPPPTADPDAGRVQFLPDKFNRRSELTFDVQVGESFVTRDFTL